MMGMITW